MDKYIDSNPEAGKRFYQDFFDKGKVTMLNLLKFRVKADYTGFENLSPEREISGEEAYQLYIDNTSTELIKAGSRVLYYGKSKDFLIGPDTEKWDAVLIVEHESASKFMAFAQSNDYIENAGHRAAGLEDSRLLPTTEIKTTPIKELS